MCISECVCVFHAWATLALSFPIIWQKGVKMWPHHNILSNILGWQKGWVWDVGVGVVVLCVWGGGRKHTQVPSLEETLSTIVTIGLWAQPWAPSLVPKPSQELPALYSQTWNTLLQPHKRDVTYSHGAVVAGAAGYEDESPTASDHLDVVFQTSQHHCRNIFSVSSGIYGRCFHKNSG